MDQNKAKIRDNHVKLAFSLYIKQRKRDYSIVKKMSSNGAFSSVYEVKDLEGNRMVMKAVDTTILDVSIEPDRVIKYTNKEIDAMKQCKDSPYIMNLIDAADITVDPFGKEHVFLLFMPKLQVSTDYFSKNGYKISDILSMAKDICKALDFCHSKSILHRDVKPENIYYSPKQGHFILSDFGISRSLFDHDQAITRIGSLLAPEILSFQNLHGRMNSDVYSLGMSVLLLNAEMAKAGGVIADKFNNLKSDIKAVLMKAIDGDPDKRYQSANEFLAAIEKVESRANNSFSVQKVQQCAKAFLNNEYKSAQDIAKEGHEMSIPVMSCLYAYILACQKRISEALSILRPMANSGDGVALGLYGIIGRLETTQGKEIKDPIKDREMVEKILKSAKKGFSVAQYYVGRWLIDGESGFPVDIDSGLAYIFESVQHGFLPAMYYFKKTLNRHMDSFTSIQSMIDLMDIALENFSKNDFPAEMIRAIATAY